MEPQGSLPCSQQPATGPYLSHESNPHITKLTNQPTTWSRVLPDKLSVTQLVKKFPAFYGTQRFIKVFTTALHWSLFEPDESSSRPHT
jgi:hypothetical protein